MKIRSLLVLALAAATAACDAPVGAGRSADDAVLAASEAGVIDPAAPQSGGEPTVIRYRSVEDPRFPADASVCAAAPFAANVFLGASLWSENTAASSGRIVNNSVRRIGTATACLQITDPTFPPGLGQHFYARFDTPEGIFTALGSCTLISNDVPVAGLVLGGCHLRISDGPAWMRGGAVTSLSSFNPRGLPGFSTGSEWTLQIYPGR